MLRMRQICLVARDCDRAEAELRAVFGLDVSFRDPVVERWGLVNVVCPVGDQFLEVVAPTRDDTAAARYLDRRGGDGGYMVITQVDDLPARRAQVDALGIRVITEYDSPDFKGIQLHPRDIGGAIFSFDWNEHADRPDAPWHPAGPDWPPHRRDGVVTAITAAELQTDDPAALARRWSTFIGRPVTADARGRATIALDDATLRFVRAADSRGEGVGAFDLKARDPERAKRAARERGLPVDGDTVTVCGTRFNLV